MIMLWLILLNIDWHCTTAEDGQASSFSSRREEASFTTTESLGNLEVDEVCHVALKVQLGGVFHPQDVWVGYPKDFYQAFIRLIRLGLQASPPGLSSESLSGGQ
jgi:hypothetical protein